jgi:hypothetical protein
VSNPTNPFSWQMPTATDLVTDLPADFEVFGQAVATSLADLLGGTSGQILAKNSNTDMDFVWIANDQGDITAVTAGTGISGGGTSGAVTITNSMATEITAKGDLIVGTGNAAFDNLPAGTNGHVLTADSTVSPTGLKWAAPAGGGKVLQVVTAQSPGVASTSSTTYATTGLTATITPTLSTSKVLVMFYQTVTNNGFSGANLGVKMRLVRGSTTIQAISDELLYTGQSAGFYGSVSSQWLDSPGTTSATTYKTEYASAYTSSNTIYVNGSGANSSIILMEIGA